MSVYVRCAACHADNQLDQEACRKCGAALKGSKYVVQVRRQGRNHRRMCGELAEAFRTEVELLKALPKGKNGRPKSDKPSRPARVGKAPVAFPTPSPAPTSTFGLVVPQEPEVTLTQAWERYSRTILPTLKEPRFNASLWRVHVAPALGLRPLSSITPMAVEDFMDHMRQKRISSAWNNRGKQGQPLSEQRVLHAVRLVRRLINYAIQSGMWAGQNPVSKVKLPRFNNEVVRMLSKQQAQLLLRTLGDWPNRPAALAFKMCLFTGKRAGEVFGLEWSQVDLDRGYVRFYIKSAVRGEVQSLPIMPEVRAILEEALRLQFPGATRVFTTKNGRQIHYGAIWPRIRLRAGLPSNFRVHDLRHAFASELVSNGVDLYTVQKLLGHKSPEMTKRYAHLADEALRRGLAQAEALFTGKAT